MGDEAAYLGAVLEAALIAFDPGHDGVGAAQGKQGFSYHRAMVRVTPDQIWAGAMQDFQYFV
jgi:hypothetical protein